MKCSLELLTWDTDFLGYQVGRLLTHDNAIAPVQALLEEARSKQYRLLYWSVPPDDAQAAATARFIGAHLADQKITYAMPLSAVPITLPPGVETSTELTPQLLSLALQSGHQSRYQTDPRFEADVYSRLYTRWIENSVNGQIAREVLAYRSTPSADEMGLITLGVKKERVDIGLLAVDEQVRGQAIGTRLVEAAQQRAGAWGFNSLQVVTQLTNEGACRFYERCGFVPDEIECVYHIWL